MEELHKPAVPTKVRDAVYYAGVVVAALGFMVTNTAAVLMPDPTVAVVIAGNVTSGMGIIAAGLGVAYRPGKTNA